MDNYKQYRRSQIAELTDWTPDFDIAGVSISDVDKANGSPKIGDKIARNPKNHADRWLVAADYFAANFESAERAEWMAQQEPPELQERVAQLIAHRACHNQEQDAGNGKLAGYCIVCGVPWPCLYAGAASIAKPAAQEGMVKMHSLVDQLAYRFKGYLPWQDELRDPVVRGHEMFIDDTIRKADALLAASKEKT